MMSKDPRTGKAFNHLPQPGEFSGRTYSEKIIEKKSQGEEVSYAQIKSIIVDSVKADGTVLHFSIEEVGSADYPTKDGQWLVALAYDRDSYNYDYHWWRRMSDGIWSHKPGTSSISSVDSNKNTILDPGNCNRGKYETFFGYFLVTPTD